MKLARSKIHRWGVYSTERIPAGRKVIEYTGERISRRETKRRADGTDLIYLFTLDAYWTLDGSVGGSGAEYINHSCDPNLRSFARVGDHADKHIHDLALFAVRFVPAGEELTFDYVNGEDEGFEEEINDPEKRKEMEKCLCGSKFCRGYLW